MDGSQNRSKRVELPKLSTGASGSHRPENHRPGSHRPESHRPGSHRPGSHRPESHSAGLTPTTVIVGARPRHAGRGTTAGGAAPVDPPRGKKRSGRTQHSATLEEALGGQVGQGRSEGVETGHGRGPDGRITGGFTGRFNCLGSRPSALVEGPATRRPSGLEPGGSAAVGQGRNSHVDRGDTGHPLAGWARGRSTGGAPPYGGAGGGQYERLWLSRPAEGSGRASDRAQPPPCLDLEMARNSDPGSS